VTPRVGASRPCASTRAFRPTNDLPCGMAIGMRAPSRSSEWGSMSQRDLCATICSSLKTRTEAFPRPIRLTKKGSTFGLPLILCRWRVNACSMWLSFTVRIRIWRKWSPKFAKSPQSKIVRFLLLARFRLVRVRPRHGEFVVLIGFGWMRSFTTLALTIEIIAHLALERPFSMAWIRVNLRHPIPPHPAGDPHDPLSP